MTCVWIEDGQYKIIGLKSTLATGILFSDTLRHMVDQRDEEVRKGAHCAWRIHYHIVVPVKYRKTLLDEEVAGIIQEMVAACSQAGAVGWGVVDRWVLCVDGGRTCELANGRTVCPATRATARGAPTAPHVLVL